MSWKSLAVVLLDMGCGRYETQVVFQIFRPRSWLSMGRISTCSVKKSVVYDRGQVKAIETNRP